MQERFDVRRRSIKLDRLQHEPPRLNSQDVRPEWPRPRLPAYLIRPKPPAVEDRRRQGPKDFGRDVTIGIAAVTVPEGHIVTVSDRMLSYGDIIPAADKGALKARAITKTWGLLFSGSASQFLPIVLKIQSTLEWDAKHEAATVQAEVARAYRETFDVEFTSSRLSRYGYGSIQEFVDDGFDQFGNCFKAIRKEIDEFSLGIDLLGYGFSPDGKPHLFEVSNPGTVINRDLTDYAVIGSGYYVAMGSLQARPFLNDLEGTIYRLLEAKFCAETVSGVGKSTFVWTMNKDGKCGSMNQNQIDQIRAIWQETLSAPHPKAALDIIENSQAFRAVSRDDP